MMKAFFVSVSIGCFWLSGSAAAAEAPKREVAGKAVSLLGKVLVRNEKAPSSQTRPLNVGDSVYEGEVINTSSDANAKILLSDRTVVDIGASTLFKIDEYRLKKTADRSVEISMNYGRVRTVVSQPVGGSGKFKFRTRTATMGVRGTEFIVESDLVSNTAEKGAGTKPGETGTLMSAASGPEAKQAGEAKTSITVVQGRVEVSQPPVPGNLPGGTGGAAPGPRTPVMLTPGNQMTTAAVPASEGGRVSAPEVKQLSKVEMQQAVVQAKVPDRTFVQNVVIDNSAGSGQREQSREGSREGQGDAPRPAPKAAAAIMLTMVAMDVSQSIRQDPIAIKPELIGAPLNPLDRPYVPPTFGQPVSVKVIFTP